MIRSREFLRRLDKLGLPGGDEPELVHDFGVLSRVEDARFWELYDAFRQDEDLAKDELTEMQVLLDRCPLVDPREAGNPYTETHEERRERQLLERAFAGAFHDYAKQYPHIAVPNYANMLNEYRLEIGYQLFGKYGWTAGGRDCSGILPLDDWAPQDREALIDLYRRANPECSGNAPHGWKSKYRAGARFDRPLATMTTVWRPTRANLLGVRAVHLDGHGRPDAPKCIACLWLCHTISIDHDYDGGWSGGAIWF